MHCRPLHTASNKLLVKLPLLLFALLFAATVCSCQNLELDAVEVPSMEVGV
jgi:hypothetical protein